MIALADHDLVRLCRDPRYAERFPRSPAERRSRARKIGITLRRPVNATPLVTVWRLIAEAGLAPLRAPAPRPKRARVGLPRCARIPTKASAERAGGDQSRSVAGRPRLTRSTDPQPTSRRLAQSLRWNALVLAP